MLQAMMTQDPTRAARELLAFYVEAGADAVIGEEPANWLADPAPGDLSPSLPQPRAEPAPSEPVRAGSFDASPAPVGRDLRRGVASNASPMVRPPAAAPLSPDAAVTAAREAARTAASLEDLRGILNGFNGCALKTTATQLVFADGSPLARVMFVGEAPGRDEDLEGKPFVGRSGKLLDRMMAAIGLDRTSAYIANIVPWRPPGNRTPTPQESAICLPFVLRQIELADPDVLVCLGGPSATTLLGIREGILKSRGRWLTFDTGKREIRAIATLHPAYLLRQPLQKRLAWRDFLAIRKALAG
jgi:uracil-DNA glycosylase family 4